MWEGNGDGFWPLAVSTTLIVLLPGNLPLDPRYDSQGQRIYLDRVSILTLLVWSQAPEPSLD